MEMEVCHKKDESSSLKHQTNRSNNRAGSGSNSRVFSRSSQRSQKLSTRVVEEDPEMTGTFGGYQDLSIPTVHENFFRGPNIDDLSIPTVHENFFRGPNIDDFDLSDLK
eukprot:1100691_1